MAWKIKNKRPFGLTRKTTETPVAAQSAAPRSSDIGSAPNAEPGPLISPDDLSSVHAWLKMTEGKSLVNASGVPTPVASVRSALISYLNSPWPPELDTPIKPASSADSSPSSRPADRFTPEPTSPSSDAPPASSSPDEGLSQDSPPPQSPSPNEPTTIPHGLSQRTLTLPLRSELWSRLEKVAQGRGQSLEAVLRERLEEDWQMYGLI